MGVVLEKTETIPSLLEKELIKIINKDISASNEQYIREEIYDICGIIRLIETERKAYLKYDLVDPYLLRRNKFLIFIGKLKSDYFFKTSSVDIENFWQEKIGRVDGLNDLSVDIYKPLKSNIEYLRDFHKKLRQLYLLLKMNNDDKYSIVCEILEKGILDLINKL